MTKLKWPPPENRPVGWSIPYVTGYPQEKKPRKKQTSCAGRHQWKAAPNFGIRQKPPPVWVRIAEKNDQRLTRQKRRLKEKRRRESMAKQAAALAKKAAAEGRLRAES